MNRRNVVVISVTPEEPYKFAAIIDDSFIAHLWVKEGVCNKYKITVSPILKYGAMNVYMDLYEIENLYVVEDGFDNLQTALNKFMRYVNEAEVLVKVDSETLQKHLVINWRYCEYAIKFIMPSKHYHPIKIGIKDSSGDTFRTFLASPKVNAAAGSLNGIETYEIRTGEDGSVCSVKTINMLNVEI